MVRRAPSGRLYDSPHRQVERGGKSPMTRAGREAGSLAAPSEGAVECSACT